MNEIEYNGKKIQYQIKKSKIKNLYIQIKEGKVIVKAPIKMPENYIKQFINKKSKWIYENLKKSEKQMKENIENKNEIKPEEIKKLQKIVEKYIQKYSQLIGINPKKVTIKKIKYAW